jgi:hypothetical protein
VSAFGLFKGCWSLGTASVADPFCVSGLLQVQIVIAALVVVDVHPHLVVSAPCLQAARSISPASKTSQDPPAATPWLQLQSTRMGC